MLDFDTRELTKFPRKGNKMKMTNRFIFIKAVKQEEIEKNGK